MKNEKNSIFTIQPSSGTPIYRQLIEQVKRLVAAGYLKPEDQLPSVRQLAVNLEVNPMTISKAYSLMEAQGLVERKRGKRMAISNKTVEETQPMEKRLELLLPALQEAANQARQLALPKDLIMDAFDKILETKEND